MFISSLGDFHPSDRNSLLLLDPECNDNDEENGTAGKIIEALAIHLV